MADPKPKGKGIVDTLVDTAVTKATDKFLEPILKCLGELCSEFTGYFADFDEHVKDLQDAGLDLSETGSSLRNKVQIAVLYSCNKKPSTKVEKWYEKEKLTRADADKLLEQGKREEGRLCLGKWCVGRVCYGKSVVNCCKRLRAVKKEGDNLIKSPELLEQGAPDGHELLFNFQEKFRKLRNLIVNIEELHKEVERRLQFAKETNTTIAGVHRIEAWLKTARYDVDEAKSFISLEKGHVEKVRSHGPGSTLIYQNEVQSWINRIAESHSEGEKYLDVLPLEGSGASCSKD